MPVSFAKEFNIDPNKLNELGVFNPIIDLDTRFFIDPALIGLSDEVEFKEARQIIEKYFSDIIALLRASKDKNDIFWKKADSLLSFKEITGTCIGYAQYSTSGNAIGKELRMSILKAIKDISEAGEVAPEIFELLNIFQENVGCDRISDLVTFILYDNILQFTHRIVTSLSIANSIVNHKNQVYSVCSNPYNRKPILLLPKTFLTPLPIARTFADIDYVCCENQRVRDAIADYVNWDKDEKPSKSDIFRWLKENNNFREALIEAYKRHPRKAYDYTQSPSGEYVWYEIAQEFTQLYPVAIPNDTEAENFVEATTNTICKQFKRLIECNGLNKLLYNGEKPKHESAAQLLFLGIADSYCKANDLDISPETNKGRGPVDFKLSHGALNKIVVEVKLTSNPQLEHGIMTQLPVYMAQEETKKAIYLIIDNGHPNKLKKFRELYYDLPQETKDKISYIIIDATLKPSASRA